MRKKVVNGKLTIIFMENIIVGCAIFLKKVKRRQNKMNKIKKEKMKKRVEKAVRIAFPKSSKKEQREIVQKEMKDLLK